MDNKCISNTTESSSEGMKNNCTEPNESLVIMNTSVSEEDFYSIINDIKEEKDSHFHDESSDTEDSASIAYKSFNDKHKKPQQDKMSELASTSYEKDVNISESNSQDLTDTNLVDGQIVSMPINLPTALTALPIMKILSVKSGPHICLECCFKCKMVFRLLDSPLHICRLRSIDKQNELLKIEPSLNVDSCLCDCCWKSLENTYKYNKSKNKKEESYSEKKSRLLERYVKKYVPKNQNQARKCSIHLCSRPYCHKMSVNECENIKQLYLTFESCRFVFVQSTKQTIDFLKFPLCLCDIHNSLILVMSSCQICGDKLNAPFNTDDWFMYKTWNLILIENKLPLILKPGMFICGTCKGHISKPNPGFPTIDLPRLRGYIRISNANRLKLYGDSQNNLFNTCQGSTDEASPIVVPKIGEEKECILSTKVKFSDPLITAMYDDEIDCNTNESETSTELLNVAEQKLCTPILEPKDSLTIVNPVSTKRKQSNVICDTVSNKDVKKQRLSEKYSSHGDNSTDNNTTKSYRNKNIAHPSINSPSILNMTSNCKNKYEPNFDLSDSDSSSDSEIFSFSDNESILPDCEIKETDYIIVASDDDLSLDSN